MEKGLKDILNKLNVKNGRHWFENSLEKGFLAQEKPPQPKDYFYAGYAGQCPRYIQASMQAKLPYEPMTFKTRKNFEYGNSAHSRFQDAIKIIDPAAKSEVVIRFLTNGILISGRADLLLKSPLNNLVVAEFKTMNGTEFKTLKNAKHEHICQLMIYLHHLDLKHGLIIYENKDDKNALGLLPELKIFEIEYDPVLFESVIADFLEVAKANLEGRTACRFTPCPNKYCEVKCDANDALEQEETGTVEEPF